MEEAAMRRKGQTSQRRGTIGRILAVAAFVLGSFLCLAGYPKLTPEVLKKAEKLIQQATRPEQLHKAGATLWYHRDPELRKAKWRVWQQLLRRLDEFLQKDLQRYGKEAEVLSDEVEGTAAFIARELAEDEDIPWPWIQSFLEQSRQPLRGILVCAGLSRGLECAQAVKPFIMETGRECQLRIIRCRIRDLLPGTIGLMSLQEMKQFGKLALRLPDDPVAALEKQIRLTPKKSRWGLAKEVAKLQCPIDKKLALWKLCIEESFLPETAHVLATDCFIPAARLLEEARKSQFLQAHFFYMALAWRWIDPECRKLWQQAKDQPIAADRKFYTKEHLCEIAQALFHVGMENPDEGVRYVAYRQLKDLNQELKDPKLDQKIQWIAARERERLRQETLAGKPGIGTLYLGYVDDLQELAELAKSRNPILSNRAFNKLVEILRKEKDVPESVGRVILQELEPVLQKGTTHYLLNALEVLTVWSGPTLAEERKKMIERLLKQMLRAPNSQIRAGEFEQPLPMWTYEEKGFKEIISMLTEATWIKNEDIRDWIQRLGKPLSEYLWFVLAKRGDPEAQRQIRRLALEGSRNYIRWMAVEYLEQYGTVDDLAILEKVKEQDPYWLDPRKYYEDEASFRYSTAGYFGAWEYKEPVPKRVWPIRDRAKRAIREMKWKFEKKQKPPSAPAQSKRQ